MNIILNSYCNLKCNYCFADEYMEETVKTPGKSMDFGFFTRLTSSPYYLDQASEFVRFLGWKCTKNSRFPSAPRIGDAVVDTCLNPSVSATAITSSTTREWILASRTIPPFPTSLRPASNWGFTSAAISLFVVSSKGSTGSISFREIKDTSMVTHENARRLTGKSAGFR